MDAKITTLAEIRPGTRALIRDLLHDGDILTRLLELGLLPGVEVRLVRRAPLGCPVEIDVSGARFSLRRDVLDSILVDGCA